MWKGLVSVGAVLLLVCSSGACRRDAAPNSKAAPALPTPIDADKTQLVTVVTDDWNRFQATLRRYERSQGKAWKAVAAPVDVVLGREGYGWGHGLHGGGAPANRPGPIKREGDGRSPAGVFKIGTAYGYAAQRDEMLLPYVHANSALRCVDDPKSAHYNRIVSTADTAVDWKSAEHMRREDALYEIAIVVEHNTQPTIPDAGSCIFIHVWRGPDSGMTGCTAMPLGTLENLARWLKPGVAALVALPRGEYDALRVAWQLPD